MAVPPNVAVEEHPVNHQWYRCRDYVIERNSRGRILIIKRFQSCEHCATERVTVIDVSTWRLVGRPRYVYLKGQQISRMRKEAWRKAQFILTTDLPADDVEQLTRAKIAEA